MPNSVSGKDEDRETERKLKTETDGAQGHKRNKTRVRHRHNNKKGTAVSSHIGLFAAFFLLSGLYQSQLDFFRKTAVF